MVKNLFEKTVIETLLNLKEGQAKADAFHTNLKNDIEEIKTNVNDLCKRTTQIETERDTKMAIHDSQIKTMKVIIGVIGSVFTIIQGLQYLKILG
jgi:hypothetical protein